MTDRKEILPPNINKDKNVITHFCWDNFDLIEETLSGAGTTHSTHGIVIQEVKGGKDQMSHDGDYQSYENEDLAPNETGQSRSTSTGFNED